ncbi:MAG TPA: YegS/Rv2252/BmrU family lipid kinase [Gemmatimonadaceae bacterium]|nr:YegS/Rv2252/BmrU family lipid kinase [Gemmatimonadaceae bacterium]
MPDRKHLAFVVHGARADRPDFRHMVQWVRGRGHHTDVRVTFGPGDAEYMARTAAAGGADVVVAVGGDGTLNEVANGLDGFDTPLGVIPLGTANDFARQAGIPADADHAMDVILLRKPARIDTASLNGRRFLNVSTGGIGAEATAETPPEMKASLGQLAYAITGLRKLADFAPNHGVFRSGGFILECDFLMFAVGSGLSSGGGTLVTPHASTTDGLLDLCIVEQMPRRDFARTVLRLRRGEHVGDEGVHYVRMHELSIESERPISVNVDGEVSDSRRLDYHARAKDLWVHVVHRPGEPHDPMNVRRRRKARGARR